MGQYYAIINVDKKESLTGDGFWKLKEWCYEGNARINALEALLDAKTGRWRGDHIYIVGDYADEMKTDNEKDELYFQIPIKAYDQSMKLIRSKYQIDSKDYTLQEFDNKCESINPNHFKGRRYIYNVTEEMMIDTEALPINDAWLYPKEDKSDFEVNALSYSPLGLLLAIGNGLGLGDYDDGNLLVGSWSLDSTSIVTSNKPIPKYSHFKKFDTTLFWKEEEKEEFFNLTNTSPNKEVLRKKLITKECLKNKSQINFLETYQKQIDDLYKDVNSIGEKLNTFSEKYGLNDYSQTSHTFPLSSDLVPLLDQVAKNYDDINEKIHNELMVLRYNCPVISLLKLGIHLDWEPDELSEAEALKKLDHIKTKLSKLPSQSIVMETLQQLKVAQAIDLNKLKSLKTKYNKLNQNTYYFDNLKLLAKLQKNTVEYA